MKNEEFLDNLNNKENGAERNKIIVNTLYRVLKNKPLKVKLCTFHDIELFQLGESNFLKQNIEMI